MASFPARGLRWLLARLHFYAVRFIGLLFALFVTYIILHAIIPFAFWWSYDLGFPTVGEALTHWFPDFTFSAPLSAALYARKAIDIVPYIKEVLLAAVTPPTGMQFMFIIPTYALFAGVRFAYYRLRYVFASELFRIRWLLVFDPQMALVRQRLLLERAMIDLTEPMLREHGINLHDSIRALTLLDKLPEHHASAAHSVRMTGNTAAHPRDEDQRRRMEPGNALALALKNERNLKRFLIWYRRNARRERMTPSDWRRIRHNFQS